MMSLAKPQGCFKAVRADAKCVRSVVCKSAIQRASLFASTVALTAGMAVAPALADGVKFDLPTASKVNSPVHVEMSVQGMTVRPAADGVIPGTGHFHVLVDLPVMEEGEAIPFDDAHKHYGKGQTAADVELAPGKHKLTLQFANALHESYGAKYASTIEVNVAK